MGSTMVGSRIAKIAWVAAVAGGVATFGGYRLHQPPDYPERWIARSTFWVANARGQLVGAGADTIIVFSNYGCEYCASLFARIDSILDADSTALTVRFKHFVHPEVDSSFFLAAVGAECAGRQGHFMTFSRWLFAHPDELSPFVAARAAPLAGIPDLEGFERCMDAPEAVGAVIGDLRAGMDVGVRGTPALLKRWKMVEGSLPTNRLMRFASRDQ
jgi:protein-disulfide isomerase